VLTLSVRAVAEAAPSDGFLAYIRGRCVEWN